VLAIINVPACETVVDKVNVLWIVKSYHYIVWFYVVMDIPNLM